MAGQTILQEYLFSLGFKIDTTQSSKFDKTVDGLDKKAISLGKSLLVIASAAQAMVAVFTSQMEKLYYASMRSESAVKNIQALEYGATRVGIEGGKITASLESMARAMRANPGLQGLLESLGVKVEGRDRSDVLLDLVTNLKKMPTYVGQQYASMFGIDPDTLFMLEEGLEEMKKAAKQRKEMAATAGVDSDKAAAAARDYANAVRELYEKLGLLKDLLAIQLLPGFLDFTRVLSGALDKLLVFISKWDVVRSAGATAWSATKKFASGDTVGGLKDLADARAASAAAGLTMPGGGGSGSSPQPPSLPPTGAGGGRGSVNPASVSPARLRGGSAGTHDFSSLEERYGLPPGLLDQIWRQESSRGRNMLGPVTRSGARAEGHFQFMPGTARQFGVTDPYDLTNSSEGAAKYMSQLLRKYDGNLTHALAGYNWGPGNVDKSLRNNNGQLGRLPEETLGYVTDIQRGLQQNNTFNITSPGPEEAGRAVQGRLEAVNANLLRNTTGAVR